VDRVSFSGWVPMKVAPSRLAGDRAIGKREFICLIAMIQALQALGFASLLPALGNIATDLGAAEPNQRQWIIGVFLICSGLFSLVPGTISDRLGRKPVLMVCMGIFAAINLLCAFISDFAVLLAARAVLGCASSALAVLPLAIIRDRYQGAEMARLQALVSTLFMAVPTLAPSIGYAVFQVAGWRAIFVMIGVLSSAVLVCYSVRLGETLPSSMRKRHSARELLGNIGLVVSRRRSIGYVLGLSLMFGAHFGFINSSQQLIGEHFGAGEAYPVIFGMMAASMTIASIATSAIVHRFGIRRIGHAAVLCHLLVSLSQVWLALGPGATLLQFTLLMSANMCLLITIFITFTAIALQPFGELAGAAASVQTFFRLVLGAGLGAFIGQAYDGTPLPLACALLGVAVLTLLLVLFSERGRLFQAAADMPALAAEPN
jgi:MFS transporter, DHA1 family, multidrug resistance protein